VGGGGRSSGIVRGNNIVVELEDVWVRYSGEGKPAIRGINLSLQKPCLVLVTGPNGAGKTTLIETCLGLLKPFRGRVRLFGIDTRSKKIVYARRLCSYVPQDFMKPPHESYTVRQVIAMGLAASKSAFEPFTRSDERNIVEVARLLGIEDLLDRPIGKLSGGQQQRVFIARALVRKPYALFLDEPFSSIDRDSRFYIAELLKKYVVRNKIFAMIVSHDINPVKGLPDIAIELVDGVVKEVVEN